MARSVAERYLVAATAFVAAATWLGVGLTNGLACLFVFVLALQAVRAYQRRSGSRRPRAGSRRERPSRSEPAVSGRHRTLPSGRLYDGKREDLGWPVTSEVTW